MSKWVVQTGAAHRGSVLYVCPKPSEGRRAEYQLLGYQHQAVRFDDPETAANATLQFSSLYHLTVKEVP